MPGTIQVSILELVGLPSVIQSTSMGIKVTLGKQAHVTQDKGDVSFPLASLRDNLNVSICDSEGNEIANTVVETRSIVEKGDWDDSFALQGGGHVHMRLHFILSEDERNRIRSMRESATRKKEEDLLKRRYSSSDLSVASGGRRAFSKHSLEIIPYKAKERHVIPADQQADKKSAESNAMVFAKANPGQKKQAFSTSKSAGALDKLSVLQPVKEETQPEDQEKQSPLKKAATSGIRKMILAFETSPAKEVLPASNKTTSTPQLSTSSTTAMDVPSKAPSLKKTVPVKGKVVLFNLETTPGPSTAQETRVERGESEDYPFKEAKPILSKLEPVSAPSIEERIWKGMGESEDLGDPFQEAKPVLSNLETAPGPSTVEGIRKGGGESEEFGVPLQEAKPALSNSESASAPSTEEGTRNRRAESEDYGDPFQEAELALSNSEPPSAPSVPEEIRKDRGEVEDRKDPCEEAKPVLLNLEMAPAPSMPEGKGRGEIKDFKDSLQGAKPVLSDLETAPAPSIREQIRRGRGEINDSGEPFQGVKPVLSNLETAPAPSIREGIRKESGKIEDSGGPLQGATPLLSNSDTAPAPSIREEIRKGRGKFEDIRDTFQGAKPVLSNLETASAPSILIRKGTGNVKKFPILSNIGTATVPFIREGIHKERGETDVGDPFQEAKPVLSNLETAPASIQEGIHKRRAEIKDIEDPFEEAKPVLSLETAPDPPIAEEIQKGRGDIKDFGDPLQENLGQKNKQFKELRTQSIDQIISQDNMTNMQPARRENKEEQNSPQKFRSSTNERSYSFWETLVQVFPSGKRSANNLFTEQKWRSKNWESSQRRVKPKLRHGDDHYSSDGSRGWIFLDENICSCIPHDDKRFVDSDTSGRLRKLADIGVMPSEDEQSSVQSKKPEPISMPNNGAPSTPTGQAMKIAIMAGFGLLVFLTRQRR